MKKTAIIIAFLLSLTLAPQPAEGSRFLSPKSPGFEIDTIYNDDVFISGFRIKFDSQVYGDLFSFSYEIVQTDSIMGSFMAFARSVQNLGPVGGSFRAFAQTMSCNATVGRNLLMFGQEINVGPQAVIGMNADLAGANVVSQGTITNNLVIKAHMAVVSGFIGGNLQFEGDSLTINPNTVISGDLIYSSPERAVIGAGTVISGKTDWKKMEDIEKPDRRDSGGGFWGALTWVVSLKGYLILASFMSLAVLAMNLIPFPAWLGVAFFWAAMVLCGNVVIFMARKRASAAERVIGERLFPSMGLGFIIFFLTPMVSLVLFFTALASPLAVALIMVFGIATFVGSIYISLFIGRRICGIFSTGGANTPGYLCYTIGMTVLLAVSLIPYLGYIVVLAALMTGLGGLVQTFWGPRAEREPVQPAVTV